MKAILKIPIASDIPTVFVQTAILSAKRLKHEATIYKFLAGRCTCVPRMVLYGDLISVNSQSGEWGG